jgi:hypothetical protein
MKKRELKEIIDFVVSGSIVIAVICFVLNFILAMGFDNSLWALVFGGWVFLSLHWGIRLNQKKVTNYIWDYVNKEKKEKVDKNDNIKLG